MVEHQSVTLTFPGSHVIKRLVKKLKGNSGFAGALFRDLTMTLFRKNKSKSELHQEYQCTVRFLDDSEPIQVSFTVSFAIEAWQLLFFTCQNVFCFQGVHSAVKDRKKIVILGIFWYNKGYVLCFSVFCAYVYLRYTCKQPKHMFVYIMIMKVRHDQKMHNMQTFIKMTLGFFWYLNDHCSFRSSLFWGKGSLHLV